MSILIYERDGKTKERIFSFLKKRCVLSVVVANLNYCVDDFLIGKDNFALDDKGNYVEKRMIFEELNNLAGPIILYGKYKKSPERGKAFVLFFIKPIKNVTKRNRIIRRLFGIKSAAEGAYRGSKPDDS